VASAVYFLRCFRREVAAVEVNLAINRIVMTGGSTVLLAVLINAAGITLLPSTHR